MPIQIRSILVATDLSPSAADVIRAGAALAQQTGAALHVMHAVEPARAPSSEGVLAMQRRIHVARSSLYREVEKSLPRKVTAAGIHVVFAAPTLAILERAEQLGADLIVLGPHRTRPFGDQVMGATADQLVRQARIPCLVVNGRLHTPLRRIMVPSDLSTVAQGSLTVALRWADALGGAQATADQARITVVHVDSTAAPEHGVVGSRYGVWRQMERQSADAVTRTGSDLVVDQEILHGPDAAQQIAQFAREGEADLLVMGTRGDPPLLKALLASVSAAVARVAETPILLVPPPMWAAEQEPVLETRAAAGEAPPLPPPM